MRFHRHLPILIALCGSVALHLLWFRSAAHVQVHAYAIPAAPGPAEVTISLRDLKEDEPFKKEEATQKTPDPKNADAEKPRKTEKPKPPPSVKPKPKEEDPPRFPNMIGENTGTGIGSNASKGPEPLKAREDDQDQASLSRNPGMRGMNANGKPDWLVSPGDSGLGGTPGSALPQAFAKPQETVSAAPPAPPEPPVPMVRPDPKADESTEQPEPAHAAPILALPGEKSATPAMARPILPDPAKLSPAAIGKSPSSPQIDPAGAIAHDPVKPARRMGDEQVAPVAVELPVPRVAPSPVKVPEEAQPAPLRPAFTNSNAAVAVAIAPEMPAFQIQPDLPAMPAPKPLQGEGNSPKPPQAAPPPTPPSPPVSLAAQVPAATGDGRRPGAPRPGGDPGNPSDSDSDPFSKIGNAQVLRDGRLDVRFGRKIKAVRPHIPIVGQIDSFTMANPSVTLKVSIDESGKVTEVTIFKSSGSNEIDQPTLIALYDWWFEPLKNRSGKPIPDCVLFTINYR